MYFVFVFSYDLFMHEKSYNHIWPTSSLGPFVTLKGPKDDVDISDFSKRVAPL